MLCRFPRAPVPLAVQPLVYYYTGDRGHVVQRDILILAAWVVVDWDDCRVARKAQNLKSLWLTIKRVWWVSAGPYLSWTLALGGIYTRILFWQLQLLPCRTCSNIKLQYVHTLASSLRLSTKCCCSSCKSRFPVCQSPQSSITSRLPRIQNDDFVPITS